MTPDTAEQRAILVALEDVKDRIARLEKEEKALWQAFYEIADGVVGAGKPYRYFDEELGKVIARIIAHSERIDDNLLRSLLNTEQWEAVSEPTRVLNTMLLELALRQDIISRDVVEQCVERKKTIRKHGPRVASKEDVEALELEEAR